MSEHENLQICARIKDVRAYFNFNQREFGDKLSTSQGYISDIEKKKKEPSKKIITRIISEFDINSDWLLFGTGPMLKSEVAKLTNGVNLDNLTHRQKVEVVIGEIKQRYEAAGPEKADPEALEKLIAALTELSKKNDWTLPQVYDVAESLLRHSVAEPESEK